MRRILPHALLGLLVTCSCGDDSALPASIQVEAPTPLLTDMQNSEEFSELVANRLIDLADKLRRRDLGAAREWFAPDFAGHALHPLASSGEETLPLDAFRTSYDTNAAPIVDRDGFLASVGAWLEPWERVRVVQWKVKRADFLRGSPLWGGVRVKATFLGEEAGGGPTALNAWLWLRVERRQGAWIVARLALESLKVERRDSPLFTDVATSTGVAHAGIRFGQPGNDRFAFNGIAGGDADSDGLWDVFLPGWPQNFLYMGRVNPDGDASFHDEAAERGVAAPAGGTGVLFLDFENDGDADLFVADVGYRDRDGEVVGNPLRLYANDGEGRFVERGTPFGFDALCDAYTLTALDANLDGFIDVFVCGYGDQQRLPNDSWVHARNGSPNLLMMNRGGPRFVNEAGRAGVAGQSWTYASAAADFDQDGDLDLYAANDYGPNELFRNDGAGAAGAPRFTEVASALGARDPGNGMGAAWGDLNGDARLDLYVSNMTSTAGSRILSRFAADDSEINILQKMAAGNTVLLQEPGGLFTPQPSAAGGVGASWAWSAALFDLDLDGDLDVFNTNGFITGDTPWDT